MRLRGYVADARLVAADVASILRASSPDGSRRTPARVARDLRDEARLLRVVLGQPGEGRRSAERLLELDPRLRIPLLAVVRADSRRGEASAALAGMRRLLEASDQPRLRRRLDQMASRVAEMDPAWLPEIPGPDRPVEPIAPTRILHLLKTSLPDRQSGYTIRSRETLRAQVAAGLDPFVVTPYGFPARRPAPATEVVDGIAHHRLAPGARIDDILSTEILSRTATLAADVALRERPALIHAASGDRGYDGGLVGLALKTHLHLPLVYEVRGFLEASWTADPEIAAIAHDAEMTHLRTAAEDRVMAAADGITTLGSAMRDELIARGVPGDRIVVVPNGIDPAAFEPTAADPALRHRYRLDGRWVFGYISNLDHFREGHDLLIEATARLVAAGRDVACLIVGDGHRRHELESMAAAAGLRDRVIFTGRVPHAEVRAHYALLDTFVIARAPDRAARFTTPLKPYEAMAMGLPLVVSDLPALTEIAAPGERGLAFPAGDADALAAALAILMDDPATGRRLGDAARDWVIAERTWAANGVRYRELYERLVAEAAARQPVTA